MASDQQVDLALVGAYLHNLQLALVNGQAQHAELLLAHALDLMSPALTGQYPALLPSDLPIQLSLGMTTYSSRDDASGSPPSPASMSLVPALVWTNVSFW